MTLYYDAAGNRTAMADGQGQVAYQYDILSRLTKESRTFSVWGGAAHNPYELSYTYKASGQLATLTDPFGAQFVYTYDRAARLRKVTGSDYAGVTTYAQDVEYRAWGGVKSARFGDSYSQTTSYDAQMRPLNYRLTYGTSTSIQRLDYVFYKDGRLGSVTDLDDTAGTAPPDTFRFFSRGYSYDLAGRVTHAGGSNNVFNSAPFNQTYTYDEFGNMTERSGSIGYYPAPTPDTATYANNRRQGWTYDADGRLTISPGTNPRTWAYDAAGRMTSVTETVGMSSDTLSLSYDGDGLTAREAKTGGSAPGTEYLVRSSVLGGEVVTRLTAAGEKEYTYVPAGGLARRGRSARP